MLLVTAHLLVTSLVAHANASPWEDIHLATASGSDVVVACARAEEGWTAISRLTAAGGGGPVGSAGPGFATQLFEADSRLVFGFSLAHGRSTLRFTTPASAEAIAQRFVAGDPARHAEARPDGWHVQGPDGADWRLTVDDGWATLSPDPDVGAPEADPPPALRAALPDADTGCLLWAHATPQGAPPVALAAHLPLDPARPIRFALMTPLLAVSGGVTLRTPTPLDVRSRHAPDGLLIAGLGFDGVDLRRFVSGAQLKQLERLRSGFPLAAGSMVAMVTTERAPAVVIVLPLSGHLRARAVSRRAVTVLRSFNQRVAVVNGTHFVAEVGGRILHGMAQDGRLLLSDDLPLLYEIASGKGEAWATGEIAEAARNYPFVVTASAIPGAHGPVPLSNPVRLSLDVRDGVAVGELLLPIRLDELAEAWRAFGAWMQMDASPREALPPDAASQM